MTRSLDLVLSTGVLALLLPLLLAIAAVLALTGEKKIIYRQTRIGRGGNEFDLLKFATMLEDSPAMGGLLTDTNDPRVLPVGRFLRASKLNELPQLINVIRGDLSLVGPRPQVRRHYDCYDTSVKKLINTVRPGITGVAALLFRDEERLLSSGEHANQRLYDEVIAPYKGELEAWYVQNRSLGLYFKLLILTAIAVVFPRNELYKRWLTNLPVPPRNLANML